MLEPIGLQSRTQMKPEQLQMGGQSDQGPQSQAVQVNMAGRVMDRVGTGRNGLERAATGRNGPERVPGASPKVM